MRHSAIFVIDKRNDEFIDLISFSICHLNAIISFQVKPQHIEISALIRAKDQISKIPGVY